MVESRTDTSDYFPIDEPLQNLQHLPLIQAALLGHGSVGAAAEGQLSLQRLDDSQFLL
jgi:uncharacterized protein YjaZ